MHTQVCLEARWLGKAVSLPTPRPVLVRHTDCCWHIARGGGELPYQCGIKTPGLHPQGLLCSTAPPTSWQLKHILCTYSSFQCSYNHARSSRPDPSWVDMQLHYCKLNSGKHICTSKHSSLSVPLVVTHLVIQLQAFRIIQVSKLYFPMQAICPDCLRPRISPLLPHNPTTTHSKASAT